MGFPVNYWIEIYIQKLSGMAYSRKRGGLLPVWLVHKEIMELLNQENDQAKKIRKDVLGETALKIAPAEYWDMSTVLDLGLTPSQWEAMDYKDQALIMAHRSLHAMTQIIDAYYKASDDALERATDKSQNGSGKNSGPKPKRKKV